MAVNRESVSGKRKNVSGERERTFETSVSGKEKNVSGKREIEFITVPGTGLRSFQA
jgi:hypothetical protein